MPERYEEQVEAGEDEIEDAPRSTILPAMPAWMSQGQDPPQSAVVRAPRKPRCVVFEFESIAARLSSGKVA